MNRRMLLAGVLFCGAAVSALLGLVSSPASAQEEPEKKTESSTTGAVPEREVSARIDREIKAVWEREGIKPAKQADDEEFLRRVYLDTVGLPPKPDEVTAFVADKDKDKRRAVIAKLVDDPRFGRHLADVWGGIMLGRAGRDYGGSNHLFAIWLSERINENASFKDVIYDIITAEGKLSENPAVAVYTREVPFKTANAAGNMSKSLTGVQIQCAECHDHPYEDAWTEGTFAGIASYFSPIQVRLNARVIPVDPSVSDEARAPRAVPEEAMNKLPADAQNRVKELMKYNSPATLDGDKLLTRNRGLWRPAYAKWVVSDDNTQTANYIANRFWSFAFGSGILNPIDDFNSFNEASHPELLAFLGQDLIDNDYDIKRLFRAILNSKTYQLSSKDAPKDAEAWHFASAPVRQLSPEQFFGAFIEIAGGNNLARTLRMRRGSIADQMKARVERRMKDMEKEEDNMRGYEYDEESLNRYTEWYERIDDIWYMRRSMAQGYAQLSADDEMNEADGFSLTIDQALLVMNGDVTNNLSGTTRGTPLYNLLRDTKQTDKRIERIFLMVLAREPDSSELRTMKNHVSTSKSETGAFEDIMFALLASTEFATNH